MQKMIIIESKQRGLDKIRCLYPNAIIVDVTIDSPYALRKLSPFYIWGNIPVRFNSNATATCVEAVWQGLKVFEKVDIDTTIFNKTQPEDIIRESNDYGKCIGYKRGIYGKELYDYIKAREYIFIPTYRWMLENNAYNIINRLRTVNATKDIVFLDYCTNSDIENTAEPLSHAFLVKAYTEGLPPYEDVIITKTIHRICSNGRREYHYTTKERTFKEIPTEVSKDIQLKIDFDSTIIE